MTGLLAGQAFDSELIGDSSLMKRPMERVTTPLRQMGARIETASGKPPARIRSGASLSGISYELPVASAQVESAVLLAGLYAQGPERQSIEPAVTRDHTERMLLSFGCRGGRRARRDPVDAAAAIGLVLAGGAGRFFVVGVLHGRVARSVPRRSRLTGVGVNPTRTGMLDILGLMGADLRIVKSPLGRR